MYEASASTTDRGVGILPSQPKDPPLQVIIPYNIHDNPIPLSIPAKHFERSMQTKDSTSSTINNCVTSNVTSSVNTSQSINSVSSARVQRPTLINTNVKVLCDSNTYMDLC